MYDNSLDDGPILSDNINYTAIVKSGLNDPTVIQLNKNYVFLDHEKHALCDSYIVEFVHDATESYYERGKYGCKSFQFSLYVESFKVAFVASYYASCFMHQ